MESTYMLINLKDASSTPFTTLDDLYAYVCREKGANLEKNVSEILELCKRMDSRLAVGVAPSALVKKSCNLPEPPGEETRLLGILPKSEPLQVKSEMSIEEKLRCINEFNIPSQAVPITYTEYKKVRELSDTTATSLFPKEFVNADEELEKDQEMSKADAMNRLLDLQANGTKPTLGRNAMKILKEWFMITATHSGGEDEYLVHYCLNIFLNFYDGQSKTSYLHGFPSTINLPDYCGEFYKYSFSLEDTPMKNNNVISEEYFNQYKKLHTSIKLASNLSNLESHKLAYSFYTHYHKDRVSIITLEPWVLCFLETCCKKEEEEATKSSVLYSKFVEWIENICGVVDESLSQYSKALRGIVSQKAFTSILKSSAGLKPVRKSDGIYWPGISLGPGQKIEPPLFIVGGYQEKEYGSPI